MKRIYKKSRILSCILSCAMVLSSMPIFTSEANEIENVNGRNTVTSNDGQEDSGETKAVQEKLRELSKSEAYQNMTLAERISATEKLLYQLSESGTEEYPYSLIQGDTIIFDEINTFTFILVNGEFGYVTVQAPTRTYGSLTYKVYNDYIEICDCDESAVSVEIPAELDGLPVTYIGSYAFAGCNALKSIVIPDSIKTIYAYAFSGCSELQSVMIPDSVNGIGMSAFQNCAKLESIDLSNNLIGISSDTFFGCTELKNITLPDSVTVIASAAFENCTALESINIPGSVTNIGMYAFDNTAIVNNQSGIKYADNWVVACDSDITSCEIADGTRGIADSAFFNCTAVESIVIPDSVEVLGNVAFEQCLALKSVRIGKGIAKIGDYAFYNCPVLSDVYIPESVTEMGEYAFYLCAGLSSITIPDSVTAIGEGAFEGCSSLESIVIPNSITSISDGMLAECTSLKSVTIPESVTNIDVSAFYSCTSLTDVYYAGNKEEWDEISIAVGNDDLISATIHYNFALIKGDINLDGQISIADAVILQKYILRSASLTEAQWRNADIIEDGSVDCFDMASMRKLLMMIDN